MWLEHLLEEPEDGKVTNVNLRLLGHFFENFRLMLNGQQDEVEKFDKQFTVDEKEIQLSRYDGLHGRKQFYLPHKDSYKVDPNNQFDGQELRKITMIVFLNEEGLDEAR